MRLPPFILLSTTTVPRDKPLMIRFRAGMGADGLGAKVIIGDHQSPLLDLLIQPSVFAG